MDKPIFLAVMLIALVLGCDKGLNTGQFLKGQMFVSTRGGANITLGARNVLIVPAESMRSEAQKLSQYFESQQTERNQLATKRRELESQVNSLKSKVAAANGEIASLQAKLNGDVTVEKKEQFENAMATNNANLTGFLKEEDLARRLIKSLGEKPDYIARLTNAQVQIVEVKRRLAQLEKDYESAKVEAVAMAKHEQDNLKEQIRTKESDVSGLQAKIPAIQTQLDELNTKSDKAPTEVEKTQKLYEALSFTAGTIATVTDANGEFEIKLSSKANYVLIAWADREVLDNTESYYWVIDLRKSGDQNRRIILANHNCYQFFESALNSMQRAGSTVK